MKESQAPFMGPSRAVISDGAIPCDLLQPAASNFDGVVSVDDMAVRESWTPALYAVALAETIRNSAVPLDVQRERLKALASVGQMAGAATADELAQHYVVLEALHQRFAVAAINSIDRGGPRAAETAERFLQGSLRAQKSAVACLSALATLRQAAGAVPAITAPVEVLR